MRRVEGHVLCVHVKMYVEKGLRAEMTDPLVYLPCHAQQYMCIPTQSQYLISAREHSTRRLECWCIRYGDDVYRDY
jgi:hypothetical protein